MSDGNPMERRDFVRASMIAAAGPVPVLAAGPRRGMLVASQAERGVKVAAAMAARKPGNRTAAGNALRGVTGRARWLDLPADDLFAFEERENELRSLLERHALGIASAFLTGNFADREQRLNHVRRAVRAARILETLGAAVLVLRPAGVVALSRPSEIHRYSSNLAEIGSLVYEETGLHCGYRFEEANAEAMRKIIATADSRYVKFSLDAGWMERQGLEAAVMIRAYGSRIIHAHLPRADAAPPVLQALAEIHYDGWVSAELEEVAKVEQQAGGIRATEPASESIPHHARGVTPLPPRDPYFQPLFFSADEYRDISALVNIVLPPGRAPGGIASRSDEYADLMIWLDEARHLTVRQQLEAFRSGSRRLYGKAFAELPESQATDYLKSLARRSVPDAERAAAAFFTRIRALAIRGHYASPQGLIQELGYLGNTHMAEYRGCQHPEHRS